MVVFGIKVIFLIFLSFVQALAELELKTKQSKQEERKVRIGYHHIVGETDTYQFLHKKEGDIVVDNNMLKSFYQL